MTPSLRTLLLSLPLLSSPLLGENWASWRGPRMDGTSTDGGFPAKLDASSEQWKTELPGEGHASPILWGERLFAVASIAEADQRILLCLDRATGKILWTQTVLKTPAESIHRLNSRASSTPATDGERIYTAFLDQTETPQTKAANAAHPPGKGEVAKGTSVVSAQDFTGKLLWQVRPGLFSSKHGFCSSPILHQDLVIVNCDHDGDGYIVALDRLTGTERWRISRPNNTRSYCPPLIRALAGKTQMVLSGSKCITSYDPATGQQHWMMQGPTEQFVASLVHSPKTGWLYMSGGFPEHHLMAIKPDGTGDVTSTHVAWHHNKGVAYVPSPLIEGDHLLIVSDSGIGHCMDATTGEVLWEERLREHHASLASAEGKVLFINDFGIARWIKPGKTYDLTAESDLAEKVFASPALSEGQIFIRGDKTLRCFGKRQRAVD